jgi:hypothetical protein
LHPVRQCSQQVLDVEVASDASVADSIRRNRSSAFDAAGGSFGVSMISERITDAAQGKRFKLLHCVSGGSVSGSAPARLRYSLIWSWEGSVPTDSA